MSSFSPLAKCIFRTPSGRRFIRRRSNVKPRVLQEHNYWTAAHSTKVASPDTGATEVAIAYTKVMVDIPVQGTRNSDEESSKPARPDARELGTYAGDAEHSAAPRTGKRRAREEDENEDKEHTPRGLGRSVKKLKTSMSTAAGDKRRASESDNLDDLDDICRPVKKLKTTHIHRSILKAPTLAPTSTSSIRGVVESKKKQVRWCSSVVGEGVAVLPRCSASLSPVARPPRTIRKQKLEGQQAAAEAVKRTTLADEDDREAAMAKLRAMQEEVEAAAVKAFRRRQAEARQRRERLREYCEANGVEIWKVLVL